MSIKPWTLALLTTLAVLAATAPLEARAQLESACTAPPVRIPYAPCYSTWDTLFACSFEAGFDQCNDPSGCDCWQVSNGLWAAGAPAAPPDAHTGYWCAGAMLSGNYPDGADTRLISSSISLPSLTGCENLRLRFWHWYRLSDYDWAQVEIQTRRGTTWGPWTVFRGSDVSSYAGYAPLWTSPAIDISSYADSLVRISFRIVTARDYWGTPSEDRGWLLDDVAILKGQQTVPQAPVLESFENGIGNWLADRGQWEVGVPVGSPIAPSGTSCAGTVLAGNYDNGADTRLISPPYALPSLAACETMRLRFWNWHRLSDYDQGIIEVSTLQDRIWGPWQPVRCGDPAYHGYNLAWTSPSIDLSSYADSTIRIGFKFTSGRDYWGTPSEDLGWYIDDVEIVKGLQWASLEWPAWATFSAGQGDWAVDGGQWEVGSPAPFLPARSDSLCAGTVLAGNYADGVDTRLISPPIRFGSAANSIHFEYYHWAQMSDYEEGYVQVSVRRGDCWSPWRNLEGPITGTYGAWAKRRVMEDSLVAYADSTVRIGFYFLSRRDYWGTPSEDLGWYIDDIRIQGTVTDVLGEGGRVPARIQLAQNVPNPFNPSTRIDFSLPAECRVELAVFDVAGRRVKTLAAGVLSAGPHQRGWDGRDEAGAKVASGLYIYRIRTPEGVLARRMVMTR